MKKRNLFLSLICSIILTVALVTTTIIGVVSPKKKSDNNSASNVNNSQNVTDKNDQDKPVTPVEPEDVFQDGSAEHPYIITDVESFNNYVGKYGYTSGEDVVMRPVMVPAMVQATEPDMVPALEPVMVPVLEPVMVPEMTPALTEKLVYSYDKEGNLRVDENGDPILVIAYDENGEVIMTEMLDENGNIVYTQKVDEEGNVIMTEMLDEKDNVVYQEVIDEEGNVVMTEKLDENGDVVMTEVLDENGDVVYVENKDEDGNVIMVPSVDENDEPIMIEKVDENGNTVMTEKLDEDGNIVYAEYLDENGNLVYITTTYFELANDIDFAGVDYITLFNQDKVFNGVIDGKGFALKNITINVTKDNLQSVIYKNEANSNRYDAHIAVFGSVENAEITNLTLDNISVNVADDIYSFIYNGEFAEEYGDAMNEITVATLAAVAKNSVLKVNVTGEINADAYSIYAENNVQGFNAVGGLVAVSDGSTISDSKVDVKFSTKAAFENESKNYFVGGVAGYAYYSTVNNVEVDFEVSANYEQALYMAGLVGYAYNTNIDTAKVQLSVVETGARKTVAAGDTINADKYTWVAGAIAIIQANSAELTTNVNNVTINANVDIDVVYAGVVVEIWSTATEGECVVLTDIVVNSNVNTLQAFGFVKAVANKNIVTISLTKFVLDESTGVNYNVKITGNVKMTGTSSVAVASFVTHEPIFNFSSFKVIASQGIYDKVQGIELFRKYGNEDGKVYKV